MLFCIPHLCSPKRSLRVRLKVVQGDPRSFESRLCNIDILHIILNWRFRFSLNFSKIF